MAGRGEIGGASRKAKPQACVKLRSRSRSWEARARRETSRSLEEAKVRESRCSCSACAGVRPLALGARRALAASGAHAARGQDTRPRFASAVLRVRAHTLVLTRRGSASRAGVRVRAEGLPAGLRSRGRVHTSPRTLACGLQQSSEHRCS